MDGTHREHPDVNRASAGEQPAAGIHSLRWHHRLADHGRRTMARVRGPGARGRTRRSAWTARTVSIPT